MSQESMLSTVSASAEETEMVPRSELVSLIEAAVERALSVCVNSETVSSEFRAHTWLRAGRCNYRCVRVGIKIVLPVQDRD